MLNPLNPHQFPPIPGIQSGTVILKRILFTLLMRPFTVPSTLLKPPIIALIGVLERSASPSNTPSKMSFIPFHAFSQFPENTPDTKSFNPPNTFWISLIVSFPLFKKPLSTPPRMPKFFDQSVANIFAIYSSSGRNTFSCRKPITESAIVLKPSMISFKPWKHFEKSPVNAPVQKSIKPLSTSVIPLITSPATDNRSRKRSPIPCSAGPITGMIFSIIHSINGCSNVSQRACRFSNTFPTSTMIPSRAGCTCSCHTVENFSARLSRTGEILEFQPSRKICTISDIPCATDVINGLIYVSYTSEIFEKVSVTD